MYANLKKIYDETRLDGFAMAMTYIVDKGWSNVKEITDEEINEMQGNGLMTQGFVQWLVKLARDIVNATESPCEIIQFCDSESVFETTYFTNGEHISRRELEDGMGKLLRYVAYDEELIMPTSNEEETKEQLADLLELSTDELETLMERG